MPCKRQQEKIGIRSISSEVHSALLDLLRGHTLPKKERTPQIIAAYRIKMRRIASNASILNPLSGQQENRVLIDVQSCGESQILLENHEVKSCIKFYYAKCKGVGARKLYNTITKVFCGIIIGKGDTEFHQ